LDVKTLTVGSLAANCYVVSAGGDAVVIDPGAEPRKILKAVGTRAARPLKDGDLLEFPGFSLTVIATPGHTPGVLFSGDTLFAGGVGRTDLPGGSAEALYNSIRERMLSLADDTAVYPGHGEPTTVGCEKALRPSFASGGV
jgi:glyoxylase-like metal-dependent hydrolase (beta-lactamase superfamily II)